MWSAIRILNVVGADVLPVGVDSVFLNLCPAWFCGGLAEEVGKGAGWL